MLITPVNSNNKILFGYSVFFILNIVLKCIVEVRLIRYCLSFFVIIYVYLGVINHKEITCEVCAYYFNRYSEVFFFFVCFIFLSKVLLQCKNKRNSYKSERKKMDLERKLKHAYQIDYRILSTKELVLVLVNVACPLSKSFSYKYSTVIRLSVFAVQWTKVLHFSSVVHPWSPFESILGKIVSEFIFLVTIKLLR